MAVVELHFDDMSTKIIIMGSDDCAFCLSSIRVLDVHCDVVARNKDFVRHDTLRMDEVLMDVD